MIKKTNISQSIILAICMTSHLAFGATSSEDIYRSESIESSGTSKSFDSYKMKKMILGGALVLGTIAVLGYYFYPRSGADDNKKPDEGTSLALKGKVKVDQQNIEALKQLLGEQDFNKVCSESNVVDFDKLQQQLSGRDADNQKKINDLIELISARKALKDARAKLPKNHKFIAKADELLAKQDASLAELTQLTTQVALATAKAVLQEAYDKLAKTQWDPELRKKLLAKADELLVKENASLEELTQLTTQMTLAHAQAVLHNSYYKLRILNTRVELCQDQNGTLIQLIENLLLQDPNATLEKLIDGLIKAEQALYDSTQTSLAMYEVYAKALVDADQQIITTRERHQEIIKKARANYQVALIKNQTEPLKRLQRAILLIEGYWNKETNVVEEEDDEEEDDEEEDDEEEGDEEDDEEE